jgi:ADP-ribose pyrophosphatase
VIALRVDHVRMTDGSVAVREIVEHPGAVAVVALDADDNVVLVNQYRAPVATRLDELPAGLLDIEGEGALTAAKRELAEEAGLAAAQWSVLVDLYPSPGMSTEAIRIYLARELSQAEHDFAAEHEELTLTTSRVPLAEAVQRAMAGQITNATAVAGLLAAVHGMAGGWQGLRPAEAPWPARPGR